MTKIENYNKINRRNRFYSISYMVSMIALMLALIPFTIYALRLFNGADDDTFYLIQIGFWVIYWIQLLFSKGRDKTQKKLDEFKLTEEEHIQLERQRKLDRLI